MRAAQEAQLFVVRRGLDPTAWTALHTLCELHPEWPIAALCRADLWEFAWSGGTAGGRLRAWVEAANWFANPTRDRLVWRWRAAESPALGAHAVRPGGGVGAVGAGGWLVVVWRETWCAEAHAALARQALSESVTIRHGTAWWLAAAEGRTVDELASAGESGGDGLFVHPVSQWGRWHGAALPFPALGPLIEERCGSVQTGASG